MVEVHQVRRKRLLAVRAGDVLGLSHEELVLSLLVHAVKSYKQQVEGGRSSPVPKTLEEKMTRAYRELQERAYTLQLVNANARLALPSVDAEAVRRSAQTYYRQGWVRFHFRTEEEAVSCGDELLQRHMAQVVNITYREKGVEMLLSRKVRKRGDISEWKTSLA